VIVLNDALRVNNGLEDIGVLLNKSRMVASLSEQELLQGHGEVTHSKVMTSGMNSLQSAYKGQAKSSLQTQIAIRSRKRLCPTVRPLHVQQKHRTRRHPQQALGHGHQPSGKTPFVDCSPSPCCCTSSLGALSSSFADGDDDGEDDGECMSTESPTASEASSGTPKPAHR